MLHIQTTERTVNKTVKAIVLENVDRNKIAKTYKSHVPGAGYVVYVKDVNGVTLAQIYKEQEGIKITIPNGKPLVNF